MRSLILSFILLIAGMTAVPAVSETPFAVGQEWTLAGGAYPQAHVIIGKLENWHGDAIAHVTVINLPATDSDGLPTVTTIGHMPFTKVALRQSVGELVRSDHPPFDVLEEGYQEWKTANGGVFTIPVQKGIAFVLQTIKQAQLPATQETAKKSRCPRCVSDPNRRQWGEGVDDAHGPKSNQR